MKFGSPEFKGGFAQYFAALKVAQTRLVSKLTFIATYI